MSKENWLQLPFTKVSSWSQQLLLAHGFDPQQVSEQVLNHALANTPRVYKHDRTTSVAIWTVNSERFVLKRFNARSIGHKLKRALRCSRARRCWQMSYEFQRVGLNVAKPVLMYEPRRGPIRGMAYFASHFLSGDVLLNSLPSMDRAEREEVAKAVVKAFKIMRGYRISHGDMKATNLIWRDAKLYFIDLDAAIRHNNRWTAARAHERDRKRFLKNWKSQPELLKLFTDI